jgi:hypothetical protein
VNRNSIPCEKILFEVFAAAFSIANCQRRRFAVPTPHLGELFTSDPIDILAEDMTPLNRSAIFTGISKQNAFDDATFSRYRNCPLVSVA